MPLTLLALSAQAAYLNWTDQKPAETVLLDDTYNSNNSFSEGAATLFLDSYTFSGPDAHRANTFDGFSATIFTPNRATGNTNFIFAVRGTEPKPNDACADSQLSLSGYARDQILDGYLFLKQCTTAKGAPVTLTAAETDALKAMYFSEAALAIPQRTY